MDRLEHQPPVVTGHVHDPLGPKDVRPLGLQDVVEPAGDLRPVEGALQGEGDALDVIVVDMVMMDVVVAVAVAVAVVMVMAMVAVLVMHVTGLAVGGVEEVRFQGHDAVEVKAAAAQDCLQGNVRALRPVDRCQGVQAAQARLHHAQVVRAHQVGLVQHDLVGKGDLLPGFAAVGQAQQHVLGVHHGGHAVQPGTGADLLVDEEGLGHGAGVGQPRGLDDDGVEAALAPHQAGEDADQIPPHRAADAAVVHLEHFLVGVHHQVVVNADFAELVDDDRILLAVVLRQYPVEQGGLAGAEIAGQHGHGNEVGHGILRRPGGRE